MSHFTSIHTQIKDVAALRDACQEMGLQLLEREQARGYGGVLRPGEYVIRLKGPYDIALNRQADGTYDLTTDWWNGHVQQEVGPNFGRLVQQYGVHKTIREAHRKGYSVTRQTLKDGAIKLCIQGR